MHQQLKKGLIKGFTVVELLIVIVVIGILVGLIIVGYNGVVSGARDKAVLSDMDGVEAQVARYATKNSGQLSAVLSWYSADSPNSNIDFVPTPGNIVDVSANDKDYCIRIFNPSSTKYKTLLDAAKKESSTGACTRLAPSDGAIAANPQVNNGVVTTPAGLSSGYVDATGSAARFSGPYSIDDGPDGNLYITDYGNNRIRKMTPEGVVTTIAGSGTAGYADGSGTAASFRQPIGIAVDSLGNIFIGDSNNHVIRKITPDGTVTTFAGAAGILGNTNGTGSGARFGFLHDLAIDSYDNIYVADQYNRLIRKVTPTGTVTTLAGSGTSTHADGTGVAASFTNPMYLTVDRNGNVFVSDNNRLRKVTSVGVVTTLAGDGTVGYADGTGSAARFSGLYGVDVDYSGNVYAADASNGRIRKVTQAGVVTTFAGNGTLSSIDGTTTSASFRYPYGIVVTPSGAIYNIDNSGHRVRKIE